MPPMIGLISLSSSAPRKHSFLSPYHRLLWTSLHFHLEVHRRRVSVPGESPAELLVLRSIFGIPGWRSLRHFTRRRTDAEARLQQFEREYFLLNVAELKDVVCE